MRRTKCCILCGNESFLLDTSVPGYQEPQTFEVFHCPNCNTSFTFPRVDSRYIYDLIYQNKDKIKGYDRYLYYADQVTKLKNPLQFLIKVEDVYWSANEALKRIKVNPKQHLLEIGSGLGYLTYSLKEAGYNIVGTDISEEAVHFAKEKYGNLYFVSNIFEYAITNSNKYDVIIATELIEHISDILPFFENVYRLLNASGSIILTTPNKSIYPNDSIWHTDLPPVHSWWFSEDSIRYLAKAFDMDVFFIDFSDYHKKHYKSVSFKKIKTTSGRNHFFDRNGNIYSSKKNNNSYINKFKQLLLQNSIVGPLFRKIELLRDSDKVRCTTQGVVLCAVLTKRS